MRTKNMLIVAIVIMLAGLAIYQSFQKNNRAAMAKEQAPKINYSAPEFKLVALDGLEYSVGGERSKPLLINFWASWCGPCELEAPDLKELYDQYKDSIDFYAVNMTVGDRMDNIKSFVKFFDFRFPVLLDQKGEVGDLYRIRGLPTSFLVDKDGVIRDMFSILPREDLEKRIKRMIDK